MIRPALHILIHFAVPGLAAWLACRKHFLRAWAIMSATILVDMDHLMATPVFDPNRCSIGFHPLHSVAAIGCYALMCFVPDSRTLRLAGGGLIIHMILDRLDCLYMG